ncbi:uncharacterized protein DEA37_0005754 [Paragonimus westermani]|uniref:Uncharacterized protein n=1 Tax=Paragonimus westermani TaxID=34504 RepID=A0A5J4NSH0_9TREM|nr:uncharacterized protein DEA37_0005754 [Paragonimus westermani]
MATQQSASRHRKQRFPRLERRRFCASPSYQRVNPSDDDCPLPREESAHYDNCKRFRPEVSSVQKSYRSVRPPATATVVKSIDTNDPCLPSCRPDKRARDEHNEQERSRRRELAVIYELIRCSFSDEDLRHLGQCSGPKSIDKLSYPQVLHVAYHLLREEQHNLILFERALNEMKRLEKELVTIGLSVPERPCIPSIKDNYRKIIQLVDNLLKHDKSARTIDGVYEVTPAERAAMGNRQIALLRPRPYGSIPDHQHYQSGSFYSDPTFRYIRRPVRTDSSHHPRTNELPTISSGTGDDCMSVWDKVSRKLKRSASSASVNHLDSDLPTSFDNVYFRSRVAPPEDYLSADGHSRRLNNDDEDDEADVMIDFLPHLY